MVGIECFRCERAFQGLRKDCSRGWRWFWQVALTIKEGSLNGDTRKTKFIALFSACVGTFCSCMSGELRAEQIVRVAQVSG